MYQVITIKKIDGHKRCIGQCCRPEIQLSSNLNAAKITFIRKLNSMMLDCGKEPFKFNAKYMNEFSHAYTFKTSDLELLDDVDFIDYVNASFDLVNRETCYRDYRYLICIYVINGSNDFRLLSTNKLIGDTQNDDEENEEDM